MKIKEGLVDAKVKCNSKSDFGYHQAREAVHMNYHANHIASFAKVRTSIIFISSPLQDTIGHVTSLQEAQSCI